MLQQARASEKSLTIDQSPEKRPRSVSLLPVTISHDSTEKKPHWNVLFLQLSQAGYPMIKSPEDVAQAGKNTIDALTKSGAALTGGFGEISQYIMSSTHKSVTANLTASKEVLNIKTPDEWIDFHSRWAGDFIGTTIAQMTHLSKLSTKILSQTYEPFKTHLSATFGKINGG